MFFFGGIMGVLGVLKASGDIRYPQGFLSTGVLFLMFLFSFWEGSGSCCCILVPPNRQTNE